MTSSAKELTTGTASTLVTAESTESKDQTLEPATTELFLDMEPLSRIASGKTVRIPKNPQFNRKDVVNAFQSAFELVGGVPRLALWANENYSDFAKLYARLLPSQSSSALGEANTLRIEMAIKPGPLDE
jgi:hypothetical protein